MFESVRARLTAWYVSLLAAILIAVVGLIYLLLARALYARIDAGLQALVGIAATSLANDLNGGQDAETAARRTTGELGSRQNVVAIYDGRGRLLGEAGREDDIVIPLVPADEIPTDVVRFITIVETDDRDDRHRLAMQRVVVPAFEAPFVIVTGTSLEPTDEELESLRSILIYVVPLSLVIAGIGGWFLAGRSLSPVVAMADRARQIGIENLGERLPVANPRDELGRLAGTFNELLARLQGSMNQQRQFMADASHELRTPVTTARTAATVALQQPSRAEAEYRETLAIVEQETTRLSRIVDDMFTLARADAGSYPIRIAPMYVDEVVDDVVRAARVVASSRDVTIAAASVRPAPFSGDEDLIRRLIVNLLDNAVRYAPSGSRVRVALDRDAGGAYAISVSDEGPGIPAEIQPRIFERFYRVDAARTHGESSDGGAGLGLALVRWIARAHGGDVTVAASSRLGSTFVVTLKDSTPPAP
ncbi:MAG TPA: ATP-binding protein [Vicinamibacterales bacterium]|nr:ATP-binding protein [Vicinamibacterales bacterium]